MASRRIISTFSLLLILDFAFAQKVENIPDFTLTDVVSNQATSFYSLRKSKAIVVIFTSNYCPYAKLYEQRIKDLAEKYSSKDISFMLVNSNNSRLSTDETVEKMKLKAQESSFNIPYYADKELVAKTIFKAEKTPEAFVVTEVKGALSVVYRGAIDDNPQSPDAVEKSYIDLALNNLTNGKVSPVTFFRPTGCRIKTE
ncbi:MAG: redoxin domain-containing protein [Cyclobacteriaceae bacterium]